MFNSQLYTFLNTATAQRLALRVKLCNTLGRCCSYRINGLGVRCLDMFHRFIVN